MISAHTILRRLHAASLLVLLCVLSVFSAKESLGRQAIASHRYAQCEHFSGKAKPVLSSPDYFAQEADNDELLLHQDSEDDELHELVADCLLPNTLTERWSRQSPHTFIYRAQYFTVRVIPLFILHRCWKSYLH